MIDYHKIIIYYQSLTTLGWTSSWCIIRTWVVKNVGPSFSFVVLRMKF